MFSDLLIHTVEVYRRTGLKDRFGQPMSVNPRQNISAGEALVHVYPCRVDRGTGGLTMQERSIDVFETMWEMFTNPDVDIRTDDACRVLDEVGNELVPMAKCKVKSAAADSAHTHHLEFILWAQSGAS